MDNLKKIEQFTVTLLAELLHNIKDFDISQHARQITFEEKAIVIQTAVNILVSEINTVAAANTPQRLDAVIKLSKYITNKMNQQRKQHAKKGSNR